MRHPVVTYIIAMLMLSTLGIYVQEARLDPITTVFFRCVIGAAALALYCAWRRLFTRANMPPRALKLAVFSGVLMVVNWVAFFEAIRRIGIAVATIVFHVQPFMVLLLGALILRERLAANKLAWVVLGFGGLALACGVHFDEAMDSNYLLGIASTLTGALAYAGVTLTTKSMRGTPPHLTALVHCLTGTVLLGAFSTIPAAGLSAAQWGWLATLGLVPTAMAYVMIYGATPRMETAAIAVLTFIYPAAAVGWDFLVYGHVIGAWQLVGFGLIVLASLGVNLDWRPTVGKLYSR
ncbi:DMT family transporter [Pseudoduganella violaceinigra]|uniref:DMT family transporter n=1 Tax=Pseudoduganella violaceinigra TaxID=246602 RepID=UPI00040B284D|nr:DMT family transporter [Pseudoduganella violaceinigra]